MQTRLNRRASRSAEGIRFLFLASGLISASDNFDAVRSLASIVHRAPEDKTLGPIVHQMKDLLDVLVISPNEACSHSVVPTGLNGVIYQGISLRYDQLLCAAEDSLALRGHYR